MNSSSEDEQDAPFDEQATSDLSLQPRTRLETAAGRGYMTIPWLVDQGFEGFVRFDAISHENVRTEHGVYAVVRENIHDPQFVVPGTGRNGSHYSVDILQGAWVSEATILYFGKAQCKLGIYERLNKYRRFGNGRKSGHSGGRAIWQLADAQDLKVCWLRTGSQDPVEVESSLIHLFKGIPEGPRPFANRVDGKKHQK